jgi:hypothetical protein
VATTANILRQYGANTVQDTPEPAQFGESLLGDDASPQTPSEPEPLDDDDVVRIVKECYEESKQARWTRDQRNQVNYDAYHCRQDTSGKIVGQSAEFVPKVAEALEQFAAYIKRGMVSFGNYFSVKLEPNPAITGQGPLTESGVVQLLRRRLEDADEIPPGLLDFPTLVSDGIKTGGLSGLVIAKVSGRKVPTRRLSVDMVPIRAIVPDPVTGTFGEATLGHTEQLSMQEGRVWRLMIELIPFEDYFPDPKNRGLYEIHRSYVDLHEVIELSEGEDPKYDPAAVQELADSFPQYSENENVRQQEQRTDQPEGQTPTFRKEVELLDFWGTLLDEEGRVVYRNICCTVANDTYLIRKPEPNPYWHQESPFVACALQRVPFSTFHKGLFDHPVRLNLAMNELFNLIVDSGIGAVWGVRQIKLDMVENADDFSDGIPQGSTIFVKQDHPDGVPVMQQLMTGAVPQDALQAYQLLEKEFDGAVLLSNTSQSHTPRKEVSATATASADQATGAMIDSVIAELEQGFIKPVLRLSWLTMLQNADDWEAEDVAGCIGPQTAKQFAAMSPARRYAIYAQGSRFTVSGLSTMVARTKEFQKLMAVLAAIQQSPVLLQVLMTESSPKKIFYHMLRCLNLDPEDLQITEEEKQSLETRMTQLPLFQQAAGGAQGAQQPQSPLTSAPGSPTQQTQAGIAQLNQPPQGL